MYSDIDIKDELFRIISNSDLKTAVTGQVCKRKRPKNSTKEDVVISVVANQNGQLQDAVVNVNVYLNADEVEYDGGIQYEEPTIRARELCSVCKEVLERINGGYFLYTLKSQRVLEVPSTPYFCINNTLELRINNE